jgi:uncharacterized membrane protein
MKRIYSIDITRGIVMIIMALDHVRDLMHLHSNTQSPTDLLTTTPLLFFTRWITHLCAPTFVFLAGASAWLSYRKNNDTSQSRNFLLKRGLWLIFLDLTVINFGLFFDPGFHTMLFEVFSAIGLGFIVLALLLKLPANVLGVTGLVIIFGHDLVSLIPLQAGSLAMTAFSPFFSPSVFPLFTGHVFIIAYPPLPWLGIMLVGFAAGRLFELPEERRKRMFVRIGFSALFLFAALRYSNWYGDPMTWASQKNAVLTFLSFMNVSKYSPSLLFCLLMLGILFLILALTEHIRNRFTRIANVYGKVPLFYFVVHFYLIHILLLIVLFLQGFHWQDLNFASGSFGRPKAADNGLPLFAVYLVWLGLVASLYRPCRWFANYKSTHQNWWLHYL